MIHWKIQLSMPMQLPWGVSGQGDETTMDKVDEPVSQVVDSKYNLDKLNLLLAQNPKVQVWMF